MTLIVKDGVVIENTTGDSDAVALQKLKLSEKKKRVQQRLNERFEQELPYGQLLSMMIILLKQGALTGAEQAEQATQRVTLGKIKALQAHAKQLDADLDRDVNTDIEVGW